MKDQKKVKQGKLSRSQGAAFETRARNDLEEKGWIVDKWTNNVEFPGRDVPDGCWYGQIVKAKAKWAGPGRPMMMGAGFPDFIAFRSFPRRSANTHEVIGVEVKSNGYLKPLEKEKCQWYLDNNIFSKILIAKKNKIKNRVHIEYIDFQEKWGKKETNVNSVRNENPTEANSKQL